MPEQAMDADSQTDLEAPPERKTHVNILDKNSGISPRGQGVDGQGQILVSGDAQSLSYRLCGL